jgi:hypothetical protein
MAGFAGDFQNDRDRGRITPSFRGIATPKNWCAQKAVLWYVKFAPKSVI